MIADLKPYPTMKESGIEWLGDVPEHWDGARQGDSSTASTFGETIRTAKKSYFDTSRQSELVRVALPHGHDVQGRVVRGTNSVGPATTW